MTTLLYVLLALVVLLVLITVHEFGHYCAGKIFGFKINEFSIGFGPAIYKKKKANGEYFSIRLLPLGGYCAFDGEDEDGEDKPGSFNSMPAWKRLVVLLAGVSFNFLFAVLTAVIYLFVTGYSTVKIGQTIYQTNSQLEIVETKGFKKGDIIVAVDGKKIEAYRSFSSLIGEYGQDEDFSVTVERDGEIIEITTRKQKFPAFYFVSYEEYFKNNLFDSSGNKKDLTEFVSELNKQNVSSETAEQAGTGEGLRTFLSNYYYKDNEELKSWADKLDLLLKGDSENGIYASITYSSESVSIGIIQSYVAKDYSFFQSITRALPFCFYLCALIFKSLGWLIIGKVSVSEAGGTITAIAQIAEISKMGIEYFLLLLPLLAVNLAAFNVLPIPSLDGARAVFVLIEIIFRKPVPRNIEGWIHTVGLFLLLGLVVFLDINHFLSALTILRI